MVLDGRRILDGKPGVEDHTWRRLQRPVGRAACLLNDEPIRIYVPLLMRPSVMQASHSSVSCYLGTTRTLRMLGHFYWWVGMSICTRWWLRHCLKCQARKTSRLSVRWPVISMPLPEGPGIAAASITSPPSRSRLEVTPTSCSSPIVSAAEPTCTQSLQSSLPLRARLTFSSAGIFPSGDARAEYSRTTASSFAQSFRMPSISFLEFGKLPPVSITLMAMVG